MTKIDPNRLTFFRFSILQARAFFAVLSACAFLAAGHCSAKQIPPRGISPRWFYIGWSCEVRPPSFAGAPICPKDGNPNILYSGFRVWTDRNPDGWCGWPNAAARSLEAVLSWNISDITFYRAAECVVARAKRTGLYRCAYEESVCSCLYFYEFESRNAYNKIKDECMKDHPGEHD